MTARLTRRAALKAGTAGAVAAAVPMGASTVPNQTYRQRMLTFADELAMVDPNEKYCIVLHRQKLAKVIRILADWRVDETEAGDADPILRVVGSRS